MGIMFRKRIKLFKGVNLNLGKKSAGLSFGVKGLRYSVSSTGRRTGTIGIPGTGIYYTKTFSNKKKSKTNSKSATVNSDNSNEAIVEEYNGYMEFITNLHRSCEDSIDWNDIQKSGAPYSKGEKGPREIEAQKAYDEYDPGFFAGLFGKDSKKDELKNAIEEARKEDEEALNNWNEMQGYAAEILKGNIDYYLEAIEDANPFEDLIDFGSGFEFGTDQSDLMVVEFCVKSNEVIPATSKELTKTGKLSEKDLTKTQYYSYIQDYVCSCTIKLAREMFALLPVEFVIVHAVDDIINTATGQSDEQTILSVKFNRQGFNNINFDKIDASDFVATFPNNMDFAKTQGFREVEKIV